mmetsp:Transcript_64347/g.181106  ORF Transcript_64347/g.181106 Transcript_64347/m.181106 type:complete len:214 (-) Transcript_64347:378-1019(-)
MISALLLLSWKSFPRGFPMLPSVPVRLTLPKSPGVQARPSPADSLCAKRFRILRPLWWKNLRVSLVMAPSKLIAASSRFRPMLEASITSLNSSPFSFMPDSIAISIITRRSSQTSGVPSITVGFASTSCSVTQRFSTKHPAAKYVTTGPPSACAAYSGQTTSNINAVAWLSGMWEKTRCFPVFRRLDCITLATQPRESCDSITPFGGPVAPDV